MRHAAFLTSEILISSRRKVKMLLQSVLEKRLSCGEKLFSEESTLD